MESPSVKEERKRIKLEGEKKDLIIKEYKAAELERKIEKARQKESFESESVTGLYGTVSEPRKSLSSYLRNQNKAQVSFISIIDRKAAIMIRICTTLVTGLIAFHDYIDQNVFMGHVLSLVLIVGLMAGLIFAILAAKPFGRFYKKVYEKEILPNHEKLAENNFFIFSNPSMEEYEASMSEVVKSQDLQIGNQVRANYILTMSNKNKSKLVDVSYSFFLGTFILVAVLFTVGRILS